MCMFMCLRAGAMAHVSLLSTLFEMLLTVQCYILICDFSVTYRLIGSQAFGSSLVSVSHLPVSCATVASFHVSSQYSSSGLHAVLQGLFSLSSPQPSVYLSSRGQIGLMSIFYWKNRNDFVL